MKPEQVTVGQKIKYLGQIFEVKEIINTAPQFFVFTLKNDRTQKSVIFRNSYKIDIVP